ncbi:type II toxin-antitoxin system RelE/ParE family toxin [uncultured Desulfobacter sp.]|nr:type II toxin-antitoxin system RelE/ParE family toxin [uncultured Desulfobacter sp.]
MRFLFGPGYRVYYTIHRTTVVLLLAGGDKSTQQKDIRAAKNMLKEMEE